jgi:hypothetical protein
MSDFAAKAQEAQRRIREILMTEWDPIGVAGIPEAQNEYDAYISEVYRLLSRRASATELFDSLWWAETEHMGLRGNRQRTENVAQHLAELLESGVPPGTPGTVGTLRRERR